MSGKVNFDDLTFEKFRELATQDGLSHHEKVGFPDDYRAGKEEAIFADCLAKLPALHARGKVIVEIGPGCSQLPVMLAEHAARLDGQVHFIDSDEMLRQLPDGPHIVKWPARYPDVPGLFEQVGGKVDVIIAYSVIQYVFAESNLWDFLDRSLGLLSDGGSILLGDIPNMAMRRRFFASNEGIRTHKAYTGRDELPNVNWNQLEPGKMDDSVILSLLARARSQGYHAWVLPQAADLPMANRREDVLIRKP